MAKIGSILLGFDEDSFTLANQALKIFTRQLLPNRDSQNHSRTNCDKLKPMFRELEDSKRLCTELGRYGKLHRLCDVQFQNESYPVHAVEIGSTDPHAPVLGIVGGIHGLERIGTWVCHAFMEHLKSRLEWDDSLKFMLSKMRVFFIPLANPVGMRFLKRSNGNNVDLMRNAPVESAEASTGVGGHRRSPMFPWYRGNEQMTEEGMEPELQAIYKFIHAQTLASPLSVVLDLHSGFGVVDQIWFPFAKEKKAPEFLPEIYALKHLFESTNPNHVYRFEPQSKHYCTHGDLWDYLILQTNSDPKMNKVLLPFTLEMGSWNWIKKNPIQLFSFLGPFNPIKRHRIRRTLRRHLPLLDFLLQALSSPEHWLKLDDQAKKDYRTRALKEWYPTQS